MCKVNIRNRLVDLNMNQSMLAERMKKSTSQVNRYFSGENGVPEEEIHLLLEALDYVVIENEKYYSLLKDRKELTEIELNNKKQPA